MQKPIAIYIYIYIPIYCSNKTISGIIVLIIASSFVHDRGPIKYPPETHHHHGNNVPEGLKEGGGLVSSIETPLYRKAWSLHLNWDPIIPQLRPHYTERRELYIPIETQLYLNWDPIVRRGEYFPTLDENISNPNLCTQKT